MRLLIAPLLLTLAACAGQQETTPEQYICADPETRAEKGGQAACEAFYAAYRSPDDPCKGANTLECVKVLQGLESAGFTPKSP